MKKAIICIVLALFMLNCVGYGEEAIHTDKNDTDSILERVLNRILKWDIWYESGLIVDGLREVKIVSNDIIEAVSSHSEDQFIALFSKNALDEVDDIEGDYAKFVNYIKGDILSIDVQTGGSTSYEKIDGKMRIVIVGSTDFVTSEDQYRMTMEFTLRDEIDPNNVGIWCIYVITKEQDPDERPYYADQEWAPGCHFDVERRDLTYDSTK